MSLLEDVEALEASHAGVHTEFGTDQHGFLLMALKLYRADLLVLLNGANPMSEVSDGKLRSETDGGDFSIQLPK